MLSVRRGRTGEIFQSDVACGRGPCGDQGCLRAGWRATGLASNRVGQPQLCLFEQ